jgi:hypothetical protein
MGVNRDKPDLWKTDIALSVDLYNNWFLRFAPDTYRETRLQVTRYVESTLKSTSNLSDIRPEILKANPSVIQTLRMCTCPPLARDRLVGLAHVPKGLVQRLERGLLPEQLGQARLDRELRKIGDLIETLADRDILTWLADGGAPEPEQLYRASTIIADRLCGATADPIIRNAQEERQLRLLRSWLESRGYSHLPTDGRARFNEMPNGTFAFRLNVPAKLENDKTINIPVDAVIMRKESDTGDLPLLIEAKSAGDFTNVNKRRKEEATKMQMLRRAYGDGIEYILFLCGYFDTPYLGFEAAEKIDWVWEHRISDLAEFRV